MVAALRPVRAVRRVLPLSQVTPVADVLAAAARRTHLLGEVSVLERPRRHIGVLCRGLTVAKHACKSVCGGIGGIGAENCKDDVGEKASKLSDHRLAHLSHLGWGAHAVPAAKRAQHNNVNILRKTRCKHLLKDTAHQKCLFSCELLAHLAALRVPLVVAEARRRHHVKRPLLAGGQEGIPLSSRSTEHSDASAVHRVVTVQRKHAWVEGRPQRGAQKQAPLLGHHPVKPPFVRGVVV